MTDAEIPMRTFEVEYTGDGTMDLFFDDVAEMFESYGLKIESASDGPTECPV